MKKFFALLMICSLILLTGCGGEKISDEQEIRLGMITRLNISERLLDDYIEKVYSKANPDSNIHAHKHIFFDNMNSMIAALHVGQIDEMSTYRSVADYLITRNDSFELTDLYAPKITDEFCCAVRAEDSELKKEFDDAILKLKLDGTLARLTKIYIIDENAEPPAVDMPHFDRAPTIKVAVTGDLPPLDYVTADGKPAGFNTALLSAISKLVGKNFELVQVAGGARTTALSSKQVDVIFWVTVPLDVTIVPQNLDKPDDAIVTEPYFTDEVAHVKIKGQG